MEGDASFPVFDLGRFEAASPADKRALGAEIDAICRATGFLAVAGHGVPQATIDAAWAKAAAFFSLPPEQKEAAKAPYPGYPYGYLGAGHRIARPLARARRAAGKEGKLQRRSGAGARRPRRSRGARLLFRPDHLPRRPEGFRAAWSAYYLRDGGSRGPDHARLRGRAEPAGQFLLALYRRAGQRAAGAELPRALTPRRRRGRCAPARTPITAA